MDKKGEHLGADIKHMMIAVSLLAFAIIVAGIFIGASLQMALTG